MKVQCTSLSRSDRFPDLFFVWSYEFDFGGSGRCEVHLPLLEIRFPLNEVIGPLEGFFLRRVKTPQMIERSFSLVKHSCNRNWDERVPTQRPKTKVLDVLPRTRYPLLSSNYLFKLCASKCSIARRSVVITMRNIRIRNKTSEPRKYPGRNYPRVAAGRTYQ